MENKEIWKEIIEHLTMCTIAITQVDSCLEKFQKQDSVNNSYLKYIKSIADILISLRKQCESYLGNYSCLIAIQKVKAIQEVISLLDEDINKIDKRYLRYN